MFGNGITKNQGHILVISHDVVGKYMAGPGIRYYHLAKAISAELQVLLAVPCEVEESLQKENLKLVSYKRKDWQSLLPFIQGAKVLVLNSEIAGDFEQLSEMELPVVIDGYDPLLIEWLFLSQSRPQEQERFWPDRMESLNRQYLLGDFFMCASERQRDWWLGLLEANGRINPWTLRDDPSLRRLVDVVPYGLPSEPVLHSRPVMRGAWPGIEKEAKVILWGGGLWPWLDPLTAVRAVVQLWNRRQDIRLVFPGTLHPNPSMKGIITQAEAARQLATEAGLLDKAIFFGDWVAYEDWPNILCESDIALTLHPQDTLETHLAFRSRLLDYIWAGLPIVSSEGDATSELISRYELGILVKHRDVEGVTEALGRLLDTPRDVFAERFLRARERFTWEQVAQPLLDFCRTPRRASDKEALGAQLGNPFYQRKFEGLHRQEIDFLKDQNTHLQEQVGDFERRRVVRLANWFRKLLVSLRS